MSWREFFQRGRADAELRSEMELFLEEEAAENVARGMTPAERRRARETVWRQNTLDRVESAWRDLRYALRTLSRTPGFAIVAIAVMALGIGANVALFTVVRSVLLRPLPFYRPDRLMMLYENQVGDNEPYINVSGGMFAEWARQNRSFAGLALMGGSEFNLSGVTGELPENVHGVSCTWNLFSLLGVRPALGRSFTASDDSRAAAGSVLLSWRTWKQRFGGDPSIVNRTIHLNRKPYKVIGVLPAWFAFPDAATQLWTPVYHDKPAAWMASLGNHPFQVIGRLRDGVTPEQGVAELSLIARRVHDEHPDNAFVGKGANIRPLLESMVGEMKRPLYVLLAAASCMLLIACLNVANLLVARATARRKELAIRKALGGGRARLLRERLTESLLLSAAGGAAGLLLAYGTVEWLVNTRKDMSRVDAIHIDGMVALFSVGLALVCALFSTLISSMSAKDNLILASLRESVRGSSAGHGRAGLRRGLLTVEVGLTVVLLVSAGLLLKSYKALRSSDMGCITKNVLTMRLDLFGARYSMPAELANFYTELLAKVRALPGVEAAGFVQAVPGQGYWADDSFSIVEHPALPQGQGLFAMNRWADPGYFATMGIPILHGQTFDAGRRLGEANQAVISESFAEQYFGREDPLGKHLRLDGRTYQISGIVGDVRYSLGEAPKPMQYYPLFAGLQNNGTLVVRSSRDAERLALPVQRIVAAMDPELPVSDVVTMNQLLDESTLDASFDTTLLVCFAVLSLVLAGVGIFGVLSYMVAQQTQEIGIRMALGAERGRVLGRVLVDGLKPALVGLALGIAGSVGAVRLIRSMLYETRPLDPAVLALMSGLLVVVAGAACLVPAWRASRLDPMQAFRAE